jgi:hypothetical protein
MMEVWARINLQLIHVRRLKEVIFWPIGRGLRTRRRGIRALGIKCSN